jgi:hypothetical protein
MSDVGDRNACMIMDNLMKADPASETLWKECKVIPVLNKLSTTPYRHMGKWMYRSTFSWPGHWLEVSGHLHVPATLLPAKEPWYPLGRKLGGPQSWSGRCGEENIFYSTGTWTLTPWSSSPGQSLYWLCYLWNIT